MEVESVFFLPTTLWLGRNKCTPDIHTSVCLWTIGHLYFLLFCLHLHSIFSKETLYPKNILKLCRCVKISLNVILLFNIAETLSVVNCPMITTIFLFYKVLAVCIGVLSEIIYTTKFTIVSYFEFYLFCF